MSGMMRDGRSRGVSVNRARETSWLSIKIVNFPYVQLGILNMINSPINSVLFPKQIVGTVTDFFISLGGVGQAGVPPIFSLVDALLPSSPSVRQGF